MPFVAPDTLLSVPKAIREKLQRLLFERVVLAYVFSFERLMKLLVSRLTVSPELAKEYLMECIVGFNDKETKEYKEKLNDQITGIFAEHGIKTLRDEDPFGRRKDYIFMESTSTSLNKGKAIELAPKYGISTKKAIEWLEEATTKTPYTTLQARDAKEEPEAEAEVKAPPAKAAKRK